VSEIDPFADWTPVGSENDYVVSAVDATDVFVLQRLPNGTLRLLCGETNRHALALEDGLLLGAGAAATLASATTVLIALVA
jgi:hypothetical protein